MKSALANFQCVIEPRDYAIFQNHGYMGLYGGLGAQDIHRRKGLKKSEQILDHMGSTELAANLFRATQAADKSPVAMVLVHRILRSDGAHALMSLG